MVIEKKSIISSFQYVLIYFMIISCGAQIYDLNRDLINNVVIGYCLIYLLFKVRYRKYFTVALYLGAFVVMMYMLALLHSQPYTINVMTRIIESFLIAFVAFDYDKERFCTRFVKVVSFFAVISLGFYVVQLTNPSVLANILKANVGWGSGTHWEMTFYGELLYVFRYSPLVAIQYRNNGIYTEPGLYQMILNGALFILFLYSERVNLSEKTRKNLIIVLLITCLTTGSTTGYIGLLIIFVTVILISGNVIESRMKVFSIGVLTLCLIGLLINYTYLGDQSILSMFFVDKMSDLLIDQSGTGAARTGMAMEMLKLSAQHPILGVGYGEVARSVAALEDTGGAIVFQLIAACGIPVSLYVICPHIVNAFKKEKGFIIGICWLALYCNTTFSQSREIYPALIVLSFLIKYSNEVYQLERYENE